MVVHIVTATAFAKIVEVFTCLGKNQSIARMITVVMFYLDLNVTDDEISYC
jgi:hypothetical protein